MDDKTKDGLKLGGMISLLVGVISLIVIIPTIARTMGTMKPAPAKEYYQIILSDDNAVQQSFQFVNLSENALLSMSYIDTEKLNISVVNLLFDDANYRFEFINYYTIITTLPKIAIASSQEGYSAYYTMVAFGIYDFSTIEVETSGQILTPVFTAF